MVRTPRNRRISASAWVLLQSPSMTVMTASTRFSMATPYIPFTQLHMLFGTCGIFIGDKHIIEIAGHISCREYKLYRYRCRKSDNPFSCFFHAFLLPFFNILASLILAPRSLLPYPCVFILLSSHSMLLILCVSSLIYPQVLSGTLPRPSSLAIPCDPSRSDISVL
jgi:hypothetical protein